MEFEWWQGLPVQHEFCEALFRLAAVKEYLRDLRMLREEDREIVRDFLSDIRIKTGLAFAGSQYIP